MRLFLTLMSILIAVTNAPGEEISPRQLYRTALVRSRAIRTPTLKQVGLSEFRANITDFERIWPPPLGTAAPRRTENRHIEATRRSTKPIQ